MSVQDRTNDDGDDGGENISKDHYIHVFAKDLRNQKGSSRFSCLYEGLKQPTSGTIMVPFVSGSAVTNHIVFRGMYQTVPVTIYGFKLGTLAKLYKGVPAKAEENVEDQEEGETAEMYPGTDGVDLLREMLGILQSDSTDGLVPVMEALQDNDNVDTLVSNIVDHGIGQKAHSDMAVLKDAANVAISWLSLFLSKFNADRSCEKSVIDLGSCGLDILGLVFLNVSLAQEFVGRGGCVLFRCILETRGLPGSFYNKAVELIFMLLCQGGESAHQCISEDAFSVKIFQTSFAGEEFFKSDNSNVRESKDSGGKGLKRARGKKGATNRGSKRAKVQDKKVPTEHPDDSLTDILQRIENNEFDGIQNAYWSSIAAPGKTVLECIRGHSKRFKPNSIVQYETQILRMLKLYKICTKISQCVKQMRESLKDDGDDPINVVSELRSHIDGFRSHLARAGLRVQILSDSDDFKSSREKLISASYLVAASLVDALGLSNDFHEMLVQMDATCESTKLDKLWNPIIGAVSVAVVEFYTCLRDNLDDSRGGSCLKALKACSDSSILSSRLNPCMRSYECFREDIESSYVSVEALKGLVNSHWSMIPATIWKQFCISDVTAEFTKAGKVILEKLSDYCTRCLSIQDAGLNSKENLQSATDAFGVSQKILRHMLSSSDLDLLVWLIPHSPSLYQEMSALIDSSLQISSIEFSRLQKNMGGLFVCSQVFRGGFVEVVDTLGSQLPWITISDNTHKSMNSGEFFDVLDANFFGSSIALTMSWDEIRILLDEPERLGQLVTATHILQGYLKSSEDAVLSLQKMGGNELFLRALTCAIEIFCASMADKMWSHRVGISIEPSAMAENRTLAIDLIETVTASLYHYIETLSSVSSVNSLPILLSLLKAHAAVSLDNLTIQDTVLSKSQPSLASRLLRKTRLNLTNCLRKWVVSRHLSPNVIPTALHGSVAAPSENGATVAYSPAALFTISVLLGDIFPMEWPSIGTKNHLSTAQKKYRAALTEELEGCIVQFEHYIYLCLICESSYVKENTIRFLSKGSGLGGGMGTFLIGILNKHINLSFSSASMLYDSRKLLEILVPLLYQPALKAAALDSPIPLTLAKHIENIVLQSFSNDTNFDKKAASGVLTMALECITALSDQSVTLNFFKINTNDEADVLRLDAGSLVCCTILDHIAAMGENVPLALNVLITMLQSRRGRKNIQHGIVALCTKAQGDTIENPTSEQVITAAQWLVQQYEAIKIQAPDESVKFIFGHLENILKQACVSIHYDRDLPPLEKPKSAPVRFALVAKEASSRGSTDINVDFSSGYYSFMYDCQALEAFETNQSRPESDSALQQAAKLAKYSGWDIGHEMDRFCVADILHPWLTHPMRLLNENMIRQRKQPEEYPTEVEIYEEPQQDEITKEDSGIATLSERGEDDTKTLDAAKVELGSLPDVLNEEINNQFNKVGDDEEEEEEIDLYGDLYPGTAELCEAEEQLHDGLSQEQPIKEENEELQEPEDRVQIDFDESSESESEEEANVANDAQEGEVQAKESQPLACPENASSATVTGMDLEELLKDQKKVEMLLKSNPALLEQLKARMNKK
jgi:hypothetical protein